MEMFRTPCRNATATIAPAWTVTERLTAAPSSGKRRVNQTTRGVSRHQADQGAALSLNDSPQLGALRLPCKDISCSVAKRAAIPA